MRPKRALICTVVLCSTLLSAESKMRLTAPQARDHVGEEAVVCGMVASTHYESSSRGRPTLLNLDDPYPSQTFAIVIWGQNRSKFGDPEATYRNKKVCVRGRIQSPKGVPEIIARSPAQIQVQ